MRPLRNWGTTSNGTINRIIGTPNHPAKKLCTNGVQAVLVKISHDFDSGDIEQFAWIAVVSVALIPAAWLAARTRHPNTADLPRATSIPAFVACGIIALVCAVCAVSVSFGASVYAFAAWGAWLPVALLLGTSTVAITSTGLSAMLRRNDDGAPIERTAIQARARRTEEVARGIAWAATACGALIIAVLSSGAYWQQGIIAAVLAVLLLLRTHGFSDARIIAPLLVVGVGGLGWVSASMVRWLAPGVQPTWAE